jgi:hypothetical protein
MRTALLLVLSFPKARPKPIMRGFAAELQFQNTQEKDRIFSAGQSQRIKRISENLNVCAPLLLQYINSAFQLLLYFITQNLFSRYQKVSWTPSWIFQPLLFPKCSLKFSMS